MAESRIKIKNERECLMPGIFKAKKENITATGPQSPSDWPMMEYGDADRREELHSMYQAITELNLWQEMTQEVAG